MQLLLRWVITAAALFGTVWVLEILKLAHFHKGAEWYAWFIAVVVMALVNALIRPIAQLLTAPLNCLTFGLLGIVVNAVMFWLVPEIMKGVGMPVFSVEPLGALAGSLLVGLFGGMLSKVLIRDDEK